MGKFFNHPRWKCPYCKKTLGWNSKKIHLVEKHNFSREVSRNGVVIVRKPKEIL